MTDDTEEWRDLPAQAQKLGVALPEASRQRTTLPDGRSLSGLRFGSAAAEVTLLHGAGLNAHTWDAVALLLGRPALAIDLPGHGDSSWHPQADYSPVSLAADVAVGMQAWTARPQVLVGHSLGGLAAAAIAARHPGLVRELILVDVVPGIDTEAAPAALREFYAVTDFPDREAAVQRAESFGLGGARADTERGVRLNTRVRADGRVEWKHHFAHIIGEAFDALQAANTGGAIDPWADLLAVTAPVTLIRGTRGYLQDGDVAELRRRLPAASVVTVDATHNVQETDPAAIARRAAAAFDRAAR